MLKGRLTSVSPQRLIIDHKMPPTISSNDTEAPQWIPPQCGWSLSKVV